MCRKRFLIAMYAALCGAGAVFAQSDLQPVAIVKLTKPEPITLKQWKVETEKMVWSTLAQELRRAPTPPEISSALQSLSAEQKRQILDLMINSRLVAQAAEKDKIYITDSEINKRIDQLRDQLAQTLGRKPTEAEFAEAVKSESGVDVAGLKDMMKEQLLMEKYLLAKKKNELESIKPPTEAEIKNFYDLTKTEFIRPRTVRFSMIEVPFTDSASKAKAKEVADKLSREIGGDSSKFDEAMVKGQTPNSGYRSGDGGYLPMNLQAQQAAGKLFIDTAFSLKQGEVSKMLEASKGYQMIKITETYGQKDLDLDDIFQLGTRMTVRDYIKQGLFQKTYQETLQKITGDIVKDLRKGNSYQIMETNLNW